MYAVINKMYALVNKMYALIKQACSCLGLIYLRCSMERDADVDHHGVV